MSVPIHVWRKPQLESTVGSRVAVASLSGPEKLSKQIEETLLATAPADAGRTTELVDSDSMREQSEIALVSATDDPINDLALASIARRQGIGYVLRGAVLDERHRPIDADRLKLSWRLTSLRGDGAVRGKPLTVDVESAIDRYPDLAMMTDRQALLATAAARETFRLVTPWIDRQQVQLAIPYGLPGSRQVRRGNAAAYGGRWAEAEQIWSEVARKHPSQAAAIHNLALAAAAAQDFSRAKKLARKAIRRQPTPLHQKTLVWIELQQREYHEAFGLPEPPEGWFVTGASVSAR